MPAPVELQAMHELPSQERRAPGKAGTIVLIEGEGFTNQSNFGGTVGKSGGRSLAEDPCQQTHEKE